MLRNVFFAICLALGIQGCVSSALVKESEVLGDNAIFDIEAYASRTYVIDQIDGVDSPNRRSVQLAPGMHAFAIRLHGQYNPKQFDRFTLDIQPRKVYTFKTPTQITVQSIGNQRIEQTLVREHSKSEWVDTNTYRERSLAQAAMKEREAAQQARVARERHLKELPVKRKIGTQVCLERNNFRDSGFVEATAEEKIKIRIVESYVYPTRLYDGARTGQLMRVPDFNEITTWDFPENWSLCGAN